ncbi:MAG: acyl-CoA thioesterase [Calothrix sp. SM1_5_4]|nr:acyl-CoA thioesterase [Calothrix sp. SM1_5_4]
MNPHLTFEYPLIVREGHLDTFGHVNNAVYLQMLEEARWQIITERGYGLERIRQLGQGPVILDIHIRFMRELRLREQIVIRTQVQSHSGKISLLKQIVINGAGEVACEAEMKIGLFDTRARKLIEPTTEWLNAIGVV